MQGVSAGLLCACGACSPLTSVLTKYLTKQSKFLPAMTGPFLYWLGKSFGSDSLSTPNVYGKLIPAASNSDATYAHCPLHGHMFQMCCCLGRLSLELCF